MSRFNEPIVQRSLDACLQQLASLGVDPAEIILVKVPGALEIPHALQQLARLEDENDQPYLQAMIALGAVIRGETYHFEIVCNESARGILQVSLDEGVPIANGVLTSNNDEQAIARAAVKGAECADVAIEMANISRSLAGELDSGAAT